MTTTFPPSHVAQQPSHVAKQPSHVAQQPSHVRPSEPSHSPKGRKRRGSWQRQRQAEAIAASPVATTAALYLRGSTSEQILTLDAQRAIGSDYARFHNLTLAEAHIFTDQGESAYSKPLPDRPAGARMLQAIAAGEVRHIIISRFDRAFRSVRHALETIEHWHQQGISLHIVNLNFDTSGPMGTFFIQILAAVAQLENEIRAERQAEIFDTMRRTPMKRGRYASYGWDAIPSATGRISKWDKTLADDLVPNFYEQQVLKQIIALSKEGHAPAFIAHILNKAGIPTKQNGKRWRKNTILSVLDHAVLAEDTTFNSTVPTPNVA